MTQVKVFGVMCAFALSVHAVSSPLVAQESYPVHPDSQRHEEVPKGRVEAYQFSSSKLYPGTERDYFVYVPAQYRSDQPAALMVFQDGRNYARGHRAVAGTHRVRQLDRCG